MPSIFRPTRPPGRTAVHARVSTADGTLTESDGAAIVGAADDGAVVADILEAEAFIVSRRRRIPWLGVSFVAFVALPAVLAIFYYSFLASPQYAVESRLVVRSAENFGADSISVTSGPGGSTQTSIMAQPAVSAGFSSPLQNAYIVAQYIRSEAIVEDLSKTVDLREVFRRPEADFIARLPRQVSIEELTDYWRGMVHSYVDGPSTIVTVQVRAFRPDDALKLAQEINKLSERLVNHISARAQQDIMRASEEEMREADARLRSALRALQVARDTDGILDPAKAADDTGKLLLQLIGEKIRVEGDLRTLSQTLAPDAPSIRRLRSRLEVLEGQVAKLSATLTGKNEAATNIAASMRKFGELERDRFLADKLLTVAEESLDRARKRAERQSLYFMAFVQPSLPTYAEYPERLAYSILLPIGFLVLWGIAALMFAAIEDHRT